MEKYELLNQIGDGTFGSVAKAVSKKTGQLVAVKKMKQKFYTWDECVRLPEVDVVRKIHGHPNIVKLREVIRENNELFFIFEYMDGDLLGVIKKARQAQKPEDAASAPAIPIPILKSYMQQILQALAYLHKRGYFHRDMKPENLLVRREDAGSGEVVKLADFGLVKEIRARPPFTDYVSTRWYRAPELLLQDRSYSSPVDIWAAGCIMAELVTTKPLFPGSNEVDQLFRIMSTLGSPTEKTWPGGIQLGRKIRYTFPSIKGCGLASVMPKHLPAQALDLISQMLTYDPKARPSAEQCLQHPFFSVGIDEDNGPSVSALEQLATASKRLHPQQQQPSPQSAPAAFGNVGGGTTAAHQQGKQSGTDLKAKRRAEGSAGPPGGPSAQKYYMLDGTRKNGDPSHAPPQPPPLGPKAAFDSEARDLEEEKKAGSSPPQPPAPSGGSPAAASKLPSGLKGLKLANLRSAALKNSTGPVPSATNAGTPTSNSVNHIKDVSSGNRGASPGARADYTLERTGAGGKRKASLGGVTAPKGKGVTRKSSKPTAGSPPGAPSHTTTAAKATGGDVDLDGLMEEFASEISTLGVKAQKQPPHADTETAGGSSNHPNPSLSRQDAVSALLSNSRYKSNGTFGALGSTDTGGAGVPQGKSLGGNIGNGETVQDGAYYKGSHLGSGSASPPTAGASLTPPKGALAARNSLARSPTGAAHAVTPSIKALLAKHRKGAYSVLNNK